MKVVFYAAQKPREIMLANAFEQGVRALGDEFVLRSAGDYGETDEGDYLKYPGPTKDTDVAIMFGVKGRSRALIEDHLAMGKATLLFDKGYTRQKGGDGHTMYTRISVNGPNPCPYMMRGNRPSDRFDRLAIQLSPIRTTGGGNVLFCGSSAKYHFFHRMEDPTRFAQKIIKKISKLCDRHIIYRPKPSWKGAVPIQGTSFSRGNCSMAQALKGCHVLVTHGSAAAMDAVLAGIPVVVLGGSIARPVAERDLDNLKKPFWPEGPDMARWCNAMAYCQWKKSEMVSGEAWRDLRREIVRQARARQQVQDTEVAGA